ncbi:MAG: patatin-like phospholipase family protein [Clostridium sp.]
MENEKKTIKPGLVSKVKLGIDKIQFDLTKEYGLVLEGGGAKGSFQIGAWMALREAGLKIKGVSGVSVGALNGALICMDDFKKAEEIWEDINYATVLDLGENENLLDTVKQAVKDRGLDITPLKKLLHDTVNEQKIRESQCELFATTYSLSDKKLLNIDVKTLPDGEIEDILLASAYLPVFKMQKLDGKLYMDGGSFDNVPLDVLVNRDYKDIIVIRIYGLGLDRERQVKIPEDTHVYHIAPQEELGGILEFDKKRSRKNIVLGYLAAERLLYNLAGHRYYIYAPKKEAYYFDKMMSEMELLKIYLESELQEEEREILNGYRFYTENIFPALAKTMKLEENWDYRDMYLRILEELALKMKISRYRVYTVEELVREIHKRLLKSESGMLC